jgi:hypothetical protein
VSEEGFQAQGAATLVSGTSGKVCSSDVHIHMLASPELDAHLLPVQIHSYKSYLYTRITADSSKLFLCSYLNIRYIDKVSNRILDFNEIYLIYHVSGFVQ